MGCECQDVTRETDDPGRSNEPKTSVGLKGGAEVGAEDLARDERESCITWVRGDELADATVYSGRLISQIRRLGVPGRRVGGGAIHFRFAPDRLKLRLPRKLRRPAVQMPDLRGFSADEEELAVTFNEADQEAVVYTTSARWARVLCRQGVQWERDGWGVRFRIPKTAVKVFPKRRTTPRQLSLLAGGIGRR